MKRIFIALLALVALASTSAFAGPNISVRFANVGWPNNNNTYPCSATQYINYTNVSSGGVIGRDMTVLRVAWNDQQGRTSAPSIAGTWTLLGDSGHVCSSSPTNNCMEVRTYVQQYVGAQTVQAYDPNAWCLDVTAFTVTKSDSSLVNIDRHTEYSCNFCDPFNLVQQYEDVSPGYQLYTLSSEQANGTSWNVSGGPPTLSAVTPFDEGHHITWDVGSVTTAIGLTPPYSVYTSDGAAANWVGSTITFK